MFLVAPRGRLIGKHGKGRDCSVETYAPHACCGTNIGPQAEAARSRHLPDRHSRRLAQEGQDRSAGTYAQLLASWAYCRLVGRGAQSERMSNPRPIHQPPPTESGLLNRNTRPTVADTLNEPCECRPQLPTSRCRRIAEPAHGLIEVVGDLKRIIETGEDANRPSVGAVASMEPCVEAAGGL